MQRSMNMDNANHAAESLISERMLLVHLSLERVLRNCYSRCTLD